MIIRADARAIPLTDGCVDCVVTSPPYWGLRDYGHAGQLGLEATPDAYVAALVAVFREVARVLKPAGTVWLNLGDSYNSNASNQQDGAVDRPGKVGAFRLFGRHNKAVDTLKPKDLVGIPWRVAFALQADGWYLRSDIIWHKPHPMPESVTDRPTRSHEYLFLLTRSARYFYDAAAIAERSLHAGQVITLGEKSLSKGQANGRQILASGNGLARAVTVTMTRNKRSVWTIPTSPFSGAHFAVFPEALVEPCILAGCRLGGLVLDPFLGSGTVGAVAERLGRRWVGTDLSYQPLAKTRTAQRGIPWEVA